jgi:hypothetical protein
LREKDLATIKKSLADDISVLKGNLSPSDFQAAIQKVKGTNTNSGKRKLKYGLK